MKDDKESFGFLSAIVDVCYKSCAFVGATYSLYSTLQTWLASEGETSSALALFLRSFLEQFPFSFSVALKILRYSFLLFFIWDAVLPYFLPIKFQSSEKKCRILFRRDILSCSGGAILVPVNDALSCDESQIAKHGLHRQLLQRYNQRDWIENAFQEARNHARPKKNGLYPMGYAFSARTPDNKQIIFFVMHHLKSQASPTSEPKQSDDALYKLFSEQELPPLDGNRLYAPIVGTGETRLPVSKQEMAGQIAKALARANTANVLSVRELYIVFRPKRFLEVNMRQLRNTIKDYAKYCPSCCR